MNKKEIKNERELKVKLTDYEFKNTTQDEIEELIFYGYYHIMNSLTTSKYRKDKNVDKSLNQILKANKLNKKFSAFLFPLIIDIETISKQIFLKTAFNLISLTERNPYTNNVIQHCFKPSKFIKSKKVYTRWFHLWVIRIESW